MSIMTSKVDHLQRGVVAHYLREEFLRPHSTHTNQTELITNVTVTPVIYFALLLDG